MGKLKFITCRRRRKKSLYPSASSLVTSAPANFLIKLIPGVPGVLALFKPSRKVAFCAILARLSGLDWVNSVAKLSNVVKKLGNFAAKLSNFLTPLSNVVAKLSNCLTPLSNIAAKLSNVVPTLSNCLTKLGNSVTTLSNFVATLGNAVTRLSNSVAPLGNFVPKLTSWADFLMKKAGFLIKSQKPAKSAAFPLPNATEGRRNPPRQSTVIGSSQVGLIMYVILAQLASWHHQSGGNRLKLSMTARGGVMMTVPLALVRIVSSRSTVRVADSETT